jgi:hypothetical protein
MLRSAIDARALHSLRFALGSRCRQRWSLAATSSGENKMAKGMEKKKETKKAPQKTAKEKKAAKTAKKAGK